MPTQSEKVRKAEGEALSGEWAARTDTPRRSVFGNYRVEESACDPVCSEANANHASEPVAGPLLQAGIDLAFARAFIHRYLAQAYADPTPEGWAWLCDVTTQENLESAWNINCDSGTVCQPRAGRLDVCAAFTPGAFDSFLNACLAAFGHAARGSCPLNEIEYGDLKADPLFQPHRLADLAAFYRAFGVEVSDDAGERHDHICIELEFMCVLAAKEAYALEHQLDAAELALCRDAQRKFLREHLGRWTPAFTRRLAAASVDPALNALAAFTRAFIETECARFNVNAGSEELLLRPVDESADSMCGSCGIAQLPPGAAPAS